MTAKKSEETPVSHLSDEDMQNAPKALVRAAKRAREIAQQTGTAIVVMRDGKLVREFPQPAKKQRASQSGKDPTDS
jgi:hypothetical protein